MDFHILTKKQAECLTQIATRETVSSFFEPLRIVRELESLTLISMEPSDQFDSGFCYSLTGAGKALAPFRAGTKYSIVPLSSDHRAIFVHYNPAVDGDFDPEEAAKEKAALERSNKNLAEAVQRLESDLQVAKNEITHMEKVRASLQRTVDDYAQRNKVDQEAIRQLRNLTAPTGSVWVGTCFDKRLVEGFYVFRDSRGDKPAYVLGTVTQESDRCFRCRDRLDQPINLNQFTEAMRIDQ